MQRRSCTVVYTPNTLFSNRVRRVFQGITGLTDGGF